MIKLAVIDLIGKRFGKLTVVKRAKDKVDKTGRTYIMWECNCDCGNRTIIRNASLRSGHTSSCGCLRRKHGQAGTRLYRIWCNMKTRCYCSTDPHYKRWGGRGITICEAWLNDFQAFYTWSMSNGYSDVLTIDRVNNDKPYSPENCRWVSLYEQANNTRKNRYYEHKGETHTLAEWARILGISRSILKDRICKLNWSFEEAISVNKLDKWNNRKGMKNNDCN